MRALKFAAVFAVVAGVFCGTPSPKQPGSEADLTEQGEAGGYGPVPAAAFEELTQAEVDALAKALPGVTAALDAADYAPDYREDGGVADMIASSVTGMRAVPGVEDAMKKNGMSWEEFQATMFKVMSATTAIGWDMAAAMVEGPGAEGEEVEQMKAELEKGKGFCSRVPAANKKMVMDNGDALGPLGGGR